MKTISIMLFAFAISACSSENSTSTEPATGGGANTQAKSSAQESGSDMAMRNSDVLAESFVKSIASDWNISENEARCLLRDYRPSQLGRVGSDPEIQAVFEQCGVDPSVVN